jgi:hypothetical protein
VLLEGLQLREKIFDGKSTKDILFEVNGDLVIVKDAKSHEYGGILDRRASRLVSSLVLEHKMKLSALVKIPIAVELVIYGLRTQIDSIEELLDAQDYFLQQPDAYDLSTTYHNPQWLVPPGKEAEPVWNTIDSAVIREKALSTTDKTKIDELLDSASGPAEFKSIQASTNLLTELKE